MWPGGALKRRVRQSRLGWQDDATDALAVRGPAGVNVAVGRLHRQDRLKGDREPMVHNQQLECTVGRSTNLRPIEFMAVGLAAAGEPSGARNPPYQSSAARRRGGRACRYPTVPGIGPIISSAVVAAIGNGAGFRQGRDFGAWLGLVPRQESTGDRTILGKR